MTHKRTFLSLLLATVATLGTVAAHAQAIDAVPSASATAETAEVYQWPVPPKTERLPDELRGVNRRIKRARRGLIASAALMPVGAGLGIAGWAVDDCTLNFVGRCETQAGAILLYGLGYTSILASPIGMIASGVMLRKHKQKRNSLRRTFRLTDVSVGMSTVTAKFSF